MVGKRPWIPLTMLALCLTLPGCAHSPAQHQGASDYTTSLSAAAARVELAIDVANQCVSDYMRQYDSPSITPGDVIDAALTECKPFFAAHRGALEAWTALQMTQAGEKHAETLAAQESEHHAERFRRIVRETGVAVLVHRRSATYSLTAKGSEGELRL